ncbi:Box C/D snoRNA accumulation [Coemansia sp. Benny D115]|nr:Box C/D snoRNA accumulation [Coemansia sp. Benny D115]
MSVSESEPINTAAPASPPAQPSLQPEESTPVVTECEQCHSQAPKYKCPRCAARTCSLACSKKHKQDTGCNGQRDRTKFVKRAEYDANTLMSDYGFLQDLSREHANLVHDAEERGVGDILKGLQGTKAHNAKPQIPEEGPPSVVLNRTQKNVAARAKAQRQVNIKYMSPGIQRSKINKTIWASSWSRLVWTLEIVVPELECTPNKWIESGFHDVCCLGNLWTRLIEYRPSTAQMVAEDGQPQKKRAKLANTVKIQIPSDDGTEHPFRSNITSELLEAIQCKFGAVSPDELTWLIRVQDMPANKPTFCKISPMQPLYTQLRYQTVLEFPTIYVYSSPPSVCNGYPVDIQEIPTVENTENTKDTEDTEDMEDTANCISADNPEKSIDNDVEESAAKNIQDSIKKDRSADSD